MEEIKVVVADDHPSIIGGLEAALAGFEISVVGRVTSTESVVAEYEKCQPDVIVLDVQFGGTTTGFDAAKSLLAKYPNAKICFYSQFAQPELIAAAYRLGGQSFTTKNTPIAELAQAVRSVHESGRFFSNEIASVMAQLAIEGDKSPQNLLDERELAVFIEMANGLTTVEIAAKLDVSAKTISNATQMVKDKLGIHRPIDFARMAIKHGLIQP